MYYDALLLSVRLHIPKHEYTRTSKSVATNANFNANMNIQISVKMSTSTQIRIQLPMNTKPNKITTADAATPLLCFSSWQ